MHAAFDTRNGLLALITLCVVVQSSVCIAVGCALDSEEVSPVRQEKEKTKLFFGTAACVDCHNKEKPREDADYPPLCRCTEFGIWEKGDKHKSAYLVLEGDRGKQMAQLLGSDVDVTKPEAGCINCHGVSTGDAKRDRFKLSDGVSCVVCHGPYEEWVDVHGSALASKRDQWRAKTREEKEQLWGMTDLWNPGKRAKLCLSCHVGNAAENKVVTHQMYAAGHPPLPGVEVSTFSDLMPRHWQFQSAKPPKVREILQFDETRMEQAELVLVSAAATLRESMTLIADKAKEVSSPQGQRGLLDFALFDCYACHHDLKPGDKQQASPRAQRGYDVIPGRPMPRPWPTALIEVGVRHASADPAEAQKHRAEFDAAMKKLADAYSARPFGDPSRVEAEARAVSTWADCLMKKLQAAKYTQQDARKLLEHLCELPDAKKTDFDSARQIAWAFKSIYNQVDPRPAKAAEIDKKLDDLEKQLKLALPSTQAKEILDKDELPKVLRLIGDFDPALFKASITEIGTLLK